MNAETTIAPVKAREPKEPLFSPRNRKLIKDPFNDSNPITVQVLGICSALAVTVQMKPSIVMALSVTVVTAFSNLTISAIRNIHAVQREALAAQMGRTINDVMLRQPNLEDVFLKLTGRSLAEGPSL